MKEKLIKILENYIEHHSQPYYEKIIKAIKQAKDTSEIREIIISEENKGKNKDKVTALIKLFNYLLEEEEYEQQSIKTKD